MNNEWNGDQMAHNGWTLNERFTNGKKVLDLHRWDHSRLQHLLQEQKPEFLQHPHTKRTENGPKIKLSENPYQIPCPILSFHMFGPSKTNACASSLPLLSLVASRSQSMHVLASARSERINATWAINAFPKLFLEFWQLNGEETESLMISA